ncbi:hypothetical protein J2755_000964 [Methanohalophilus levihalophilus]|nr:hypothetical protein [Methanohalophilus levihalophilus]MBP2030030.1 hypothetical protein [Methanohalophilus levihalophilus]
MSQESLSDEELEELLVKSSRKQIRSDYRRSLGSEASRRYRDEDMNKE